MCHEKQGSDLSSLSKNMLCHYNITQPSQLLLLDLTIYRVRHRECLCGMKVAKKELAAHLESRTLVRIIV